MSYFPVALIEYHNQRQLTEEIFHLALWVQRDESIMAEWHGSRKLIGHT